MPDRVERTGQRDGQGADRCFWALAESILVSSRDDCLGAGVDCNAVDSPSVFAPAREVGTVATGDRNLARDGSAPMVVRAGDQDPERSSGERESASGRAGDEDLPSVRPWNGRE